MESVIQKAASGLVQSLNRRFATYGEKLKRDFDPIIYVPSSYSQPFSTNVVIDGRVQKAVKIDCGNIPNRSTKLIQVPDEIKSVMEPGTVNFYHNLCYAYEPTSRLTLPLPYVAVVTSRWVSVDDQSIAIIINVDGDIVLETRSDLSRFKGVITICYLEVSS